LSGAWSHQRRRRHEVGKPHRASARQRLATSRNASPRRTWAWRGMLKMALDAPDEGLRRRVTQRPTRPCSLPLAWRLWASSARRFIPASRAMLQTAPRRDYRHAMGELRKVAPEPAAYVSESNFFEKDWQRSYWGTNYERLRAIKRQYIIEYHAPSCRARVVVRLGAGLVGSRWLCLLDHSRSRQPAYALRTPDLQVRRATTGEVARGRATLAIRRRGPRSRDRRERRDRPCLADQSANGRHPRLSYVGRSAA
jgi:Berberine and berberine like